ncbi:MAG: tetratricopeptide repeat protein [Firmicutes bacterium]|nr:tetratricopeptide repeat protein [Bacillota bacterium]
MRVILRLDRCLTLILCCLIVAFALGFGSTKAGATDGNGGLDGDGVLQKMAAQFSLARDLTGTVTVLIRKGELDLELVGAFKVKDWEHLRLDYVETDSNLPSTIITDGDMVAYYLPNSIKPRISHDPTQLGFPLVTDLVFAALGQLSQSNRGYLLGENKYLGRDVYMVEIRPPEIKAQIWENTVFWVDTKSWLPLRVTGLGIPFAAIELRAIDLRENPEGQITGLTAEVIETSSKGPIMVMSLSRFNENTWFPHQVCVRGTRLVIVQEFSDLEFNVTLPDELFYVEEFEILRSAFAKGAAFLASRNYEAAVKEFQKVVSIDPYNIAAHSNLGYAYVGCGDEAGAIAEFEQVIMLSPEEPLGYNNLAYIYIDNGIYLDKAMEMAQKAVALSPGNGAFRDTLGWAYYQLGDYERAIEELTRALELMGEEDRPWDRALVHYHLGLAYAAESRWIKSREHLSKALDLDPSLTVARDELKRIEKQSKVGS